MTPEEWQRCDDPRKMLRFLGDRASERKLRLFAAACCRRIWSLIRDDRGRQAVDVAERFADGLASVTDFGAAWHKAGGREAMHRGAGFPIEAAAKAMEAACDAAWPAVLNQEDALGLGDRLGERRRLPSWPVANDGFRVSRQWAERSRAAIIAGCVVVDVARQPSAFHKAAQKSLSAFPMPMPWSVGTQGYATIPVTLHYGPRG
jgi:hypothetical protein